MEYSAAVQDHFLHPRNHGAVQDPDGEGRAENPCCGDAMAISLRVGEENEIAAIGFRTFGCAAAIATASATTELAKGRTLDEAEKIEFAEVVELLGGLPDAKMHCAQLAIRTLRAAISAARARKNAPEFAAGCPGVCGSCAGCPSAR
jgi:NifU-like protein involved in Fe-S cluster formation